MVAARLLTVTTGDLTSVPVRIPLPTHPTTVFSTTMRLDKNEPKLSLVFACPTSVKLCKTTLLFGVGFWGFDAVKIILLGCANSFFWVISIFGVDWDPICWFCTFFLWFWMFRCLFCGWGCFGCRGLDCSCFGAGCLITGCFLTCGGWFGFAMMSACMDAACFTICLKSSAVVCASFCRAVSLRLSSFCCRIFSRRRFCSSIFFLYAFVSSSSYSGVLS